MSCGFVNDIEMLKEDETEQKAAPDEVTAENCFVDSGKSPVQLMEKRKAKESTSQSTRKQRFRRLKDTAELLVRDFDYDIIIFTYAPNKHRGTSFNCAYGENAKRLFNEKQVGQRWKNEWTEISRGFTKRVRPVVSSSTPFQTGKKDVSKSIETTAETEAALLKKANEKKARLAMLANNRHRKTAEKKAERSKLINAKSNPDCEISRKEKEATQIRNNAVILDAGMPSLTDKRAISHPSTPGRPDDIQHKLKTKTSLNLKSHQKPIVLKLVRPEQVPHNSSLIQIQRGLTLHRTLHKPK